LQTGRNSDSGRRRKEIQKKVKAAISKFSESYSKEEKAVLRLPHFGRDGGKKEEGKRSKVKKRKNIKGNIPQKGKWTGPSC